MKPGKYSTVPYGSREPSESGHTYTRADRFPPVPWGYGGKKTYMRPGEPTLNSSRETSVPKTGTDGRLLIMDSSSSKVPRGTSRVDRVDTSLVDFPALPLDRSCPQWPDCKGHVDADDGAIVYHVAQFEPGGRRG